MTSIEPPSGFERAYLDAHRHATAMPDAARERVWARLSSGPGPVGGEAANDAGPLLTAAHAGGRAWLSGRAGLLAASVAVVSGAIVLAVRGGGDSHADQVAIEEERAPPPVALEPVDEPLVESPVSRESDSEPPPIDHEPPARSEPPLPKRSAKRARAQPEPEPIRASSLADERRLIEQTHAALGKGQTDLALTLLRRHAASFEAGVFVEEREALLAIATCTAGRLEEGQAAARSFLASYPRAVLAARVRSSCALTSSK